MKFFSFCFFCCLLLVATSVVYSKTGLGPQVERRLSSIKNSLRSQESDLAKLESFEALELESFYRKKTFPQGENYQKLKALLNHYDLQQPSKAFPKRKTLRVASLNLARGYFYNKHELIFRIDPAFEKIINKFPEIQSAESLDEAIGLIRNKHPGNSRVLIKELQKNLENLLNPEQSVFTKIVKPNQILEGLSSWEKLKNISPKNKFRTLYSSIFEIASQMNKLAKADIIAIQEADWGMPRTDYVHIVQNISQKTGMGYVYGTEFVELLDEGVPYSKIKINSNKFKGLHGNAILSKWPLSNPKVIRYRESLTYDDKNFERRRCYDWWSEELPRIGLFEKVVYNLSRLVFKENPIVPSVRLGSRMALVADILTPEGKVTFASTHLENRGNQKCRQEEMKDLLYSLSSIQNPVIIGGDFNTSNEEARRPYIRHTAYWWVRNNLQISSIFSNIAVQALTIAYESQLLNILPITSTVQFLNTLREWRNPHGLGSRERKMLENIIGNFVFEDGKIIDTRGIRLYNKERSKRIFSNSNQVANLGYKPTYCFQRNYKKLFCMKLDWLLVKGNLRKYQQKSPEINTNNFWAPINPRTMLTLPVASGISDHAVITTEIIYPSTCINSMTNKYSPLFERKEGAK